MPEIKNTFLKSKMNKDLDSRIIPNGEYRDGRNVSISASEGADVGALENIRGNINITNFGLNENDLEIIGYYEDTANDRVFAFVTNNNEDKSFSTPQISNSGSSQLSSNVTLNKKEISNYICYFSVNREGEVLDSSILVGGSFLNFSKNNPIHNINIIEDLLFWTDNRNQPRKININTAILNSYSDVDNPGYYNHEDHISVAKYAPYNSISFLKKLDNEDLSKVETTLKNEFDEFLPPFIAAPARVLNNTFFGQNYLKFDDSSDPARKSNTEFSKIFNFLSDGQDRGRLFGTFWNPFGEFFNFKDYPTSAYKIKVSLQGDSGASVAYVDRIIVNANQVFLQDFNGNQINDFYNQLNWLGENPASADPITGIGGNLIVQFSLPNPDYNPTFRFSGDIDLLKEKFVRFSYRFKYDDNEYSLAAPFSQHAFVPKQFGYFIGEDSINTKESSIVEFMENQITSAGLVLDLPYAPDKMLDKLKVKEIQLLYKASDEQSLKVITEIDLSGSSKINGIPKSLSLETVVGYLNTGYNANDIYTTEGGGGSGLTLKATSVVAGQLQEVSVAYSGYGYSVGDVIRVVNDTSSSFNDVFFRITELTNTYIHDYKSQKPIKVLPENEIVRVSDIVPLKAKTQESIGNRIIYGNFQQTSDSLNNLNYNVRPIVKSISSGIYSGIELNNHTLKQGRSYQVGVVLQDRYGRSSNVVLSNDNDGYISTFYAPYTNGDSDPLSWPGNSISINFESGVPIPVNISGNYNGVWSESNPMGWYSYKIVVKQQDQDYYNIYTPGAVTGNIKFTKWTESLSYENENSISNIALFNDNINKVPRDLNEVGPSDRIYSSSTNLINRVSQSQVFNQDYPNINGQNFEHRQQNINTLRPFREIGDWTIYKGVNLQFTTIGPAAVDVNNGTVSSGANPYTSPTYIYPGSEGEVDPFFLDSNKNPIISTISVGKRIAAKASDQKDSNYFAKELMVFETKPTKSSLDIYYETSTSGLISELNNGIINSIPSGSSIVNDVSAIAIVNFYERTDISAVISNQFFPLDQSGNAMLDPTCNISINEVKLNGVILSDANTSASLPSFLNQKGFLSGSFYTNDESNPFEVVQDSTPNPFQSPKFVLKTKRPIVHYLNGNMEYEITFKISQFGQQPVISNPIVFSLQNEQPKIGQIGIPSSVESGINNEDVTQYDSSKFVYRNYKHGGINAQWNHHVWDQVQANGRSNGAGWKRKTGQKSKGQIDQHNNYACTLRWNNTRDRSAAKEMLVTGGPRVLSGAGIYFGPGLEIISSLSVGGISLNANRWVYDPSISPQTSRYGREVLLFEIPYSTNGHEILNPNYSGIYSGNEGSFVNKTLSQRLIPENTDTDFLIRYKSLQSSNLLPTFSSSNIPSNWWKSGNDNTRIDKLTYKVKRAYLQVADEWAFRRYLRNINAVNNLIPQVNSSGVTYPAGAYGDWTNYFQFENRPVKIEDSNGSGYNQAAGSVVCVLRFPNNNFAGQTIGKFSLVTAHIVCIDNSFSNPVESEEYVIKFALNSYAIPS